MIFEFGVYKLDVDVEKTAAYYASTGGITCDCPGCRNYSAAIPMLSAPIRDFLNQFGIDCSKPGEMSVTHSPDGNETWYNGTLYFCGTILEGKEPFIRIGEREFRLDQRYELDFENGSVHFIDECNKYRIGCPKPAIQAQVNYCLPWVLDEPNPYFWK